MIFRLQSFSAFFAALVIVIHIKIISANEVFEIRVPVKIAKDFAVKCFTSPLRLLESCRDFNEDNIESIYLPFYGGDVTVPHTYFAAEYGRTRYIYYTEDNQTKQKSVTDWYYCDGFVGPMKYHMGNKGTNIYGGLKFPHAIVEKVFRIDNVRELLHGSNVGASKEFQTLSFEINEASAIQSLKKRINDLERNRIRDTISRRYRTNNVRFINFEDNIHEESIHLSRYYVPGYSCLRRNGFQFVNAFTGFSHCTYDLSLIKTMIFGGTLGFLSSFVHTVSSTPDLLLPQVIQKFGKHSGIGLLSGITLAYMINTFRQASFQSPTIFHNNPSHNTLPKQSFDLMNRRSRLAFAYRR
jgi:hypothetical protein